MHVFRVTDFALNCVELRAPRTLRGSGVSRARLPFPELRGVQGGDATPAN